VSDLYLLISGATVLGCWAVGVFFLRFWRRTGDRLFAWFAVAFWLLGVERCLAPLLGVPTDEFLCAYVVRLVAFVVILVAIVDKNRSRT
jgi:hypothetical protein